MRSYKRKVALRLVFGLVIPSFILIFRFASASLSCRVAVNYAERAPNGKSYMTRDLPKEYGDQQDALAMRRRTFRGFSRTRTQDLELMYVVSGEGTFKSVNADGSIGKEFFLEKETAMVLPKGSSFSMENADLEAVFFRIPDNGHRREIAISRVKDHKFTSYDEGSPIKTKFMNVFGDKPVPGFEGIVLGLAELAPESLGKMGARGMKLPRHRHGGEHPEAYFMIEGQAETFLGAKTHEFLPGNGMFVAGGEYHGIRTKTYAKFLFVFVAENFHEISYDFIAPKNSTKPNYLTFEEDL